MTRSFAPADADQIADALAELAASGGSPGGVAVYGGTDPEQTRAMTAGIVAPECGDQAPTLDTLYDAASLTKVLATWPLLGRALDQGRIDLDAPVRDALPSMTGEMPSAAPTIRSLLAHTSGLRASTRLDQYRNSPVPIHELMCREPLEEAPGRHRYINRGFILLGLALANINHQPLHQAAEDLWSELGMPRTLYGPVTRSRTVAPTERLLAGAPRIWGGLHDDNATLLGGVAGHAGVFSTPADLAAYARALLVAYRDETATGQWLRTSLVPHVPIEPGLSRGLAWILAEDGHVAYHHGFTGSSLYLNPTTGRYVVLATNAIYHGPARGRLAPLRAAALKTVSAT